MPLQDGAWVPKPIKQKDVIFIHIPFIKYPLTKRELFFALIGAPFMVPLYFLLVLLFPPKDVVDYIILFMSLLTCPVFMAILSHKKINQKHIEEVLFTKIKYTRSSAVLLNSKALKAAKEYQDVLNHSKRK